MIIIASVLLGSASLGLQDVPNPAALSPTDKAMLARIERDLEPDPKASDSAERSRAESEARLARLRMVRDAAPPTTGRIDVIRDRAERADAARLAVADLNTFLIKNGRQLDNPTIAATRGESGGANLTPNFIALNSWICSTALWRDDPVKGVIDEAQRLDIDDRLSLTLMCKVFWEAFAEGADTK